MTRLRSVWLPVLLQTVLVLAACGDDDDDDDNGTVDSGRPDASVSDAGSDAAVAAKVTNPLTACTTAAGTCTGSAPTCEPGLTLGPAALAVTTPYPGGGACTATCTTAAECGPGGTCPVGQAIATLGAPAQAALGTIGKCSKSCTLVPQAGCSAGYACVTLNVLAMQRGAPAQTLPVLNQPFCMPLPAVDGGVPDAGTQSRVIVGMDAGL